MLCPTGSCLVCVPLGLSSLLFELVSDSDHILLFFTFWLWGSFLYFLALCHSSLLLSFCIYPPLLRPTPCHTHDLVQHGQFLTHFLSQVLTIIPWSWQSKSCHYRSHSMNGKTEGAEKLSMLTPAPSKWQIQDSESGLLSPKQALYHHLHRSTGYYQGPQPGKEHVVDLSLT